MANSLNSLGALAVVLADLQARAMPAASGLSEPDMSVLLRVYADPGCAIRDIAALTRTAHPGAVRTVDRLQAGGLLERRAARDGRVASLAATSKGREVAEAALRAREHALASRLATLDDDEQAALIGFAGSLAERVRPHLARGLAGLPDVRPQRLPERGVSCWRGFAHAA